MDINSLPSNSNKSREQEKQQYNKPEKKIEPVVEAGTRTKKKSGIVRLADVFLPEDVTSVKDYILRDVIIPKIRDMLHDIGAEAWDSFWGISGRSTRGSAAKVSYVSYDKYSSGGRRDISDQSPRQSGRLDYDDIVFSSRGDAEAVLDRMGEICDQYKCVSVADMYDLADVTNDNYALNKYGWTDIHEAKIIRMSGGGYTIKMPRATQLD